MVAVACDSGGGGGVGCGGCAGIYGGRYRSGADGSRGGDTLAYDIPLSACE